jgi:DNA-directed RNA polymerase specialized sigma24 family protein
VFSNYVYYRDRDCRLARRLSLDPSPVDPHLPLALRDAIGRLPRDARRLYVLFYVEGLSVREIASRLERPEGTVKYLLHGLRLQIRQLLGV